MARSIEKIYIIGSSIASCFCYCKYFGDEKHKQPDRDKRVRHWAIKLSKKNKQSARSKKKTQQQEKSEAKKKQLMEKI